MRFLLDTNVLIPLEDSKLVLGPNLANLVRLAREHHLDLLYHPASERDIQRDKNEDRKRQTLERLTKYSRLENPPACPWNTPETDENDAADNDILYALERNAVHALVTEDHAIHRKAQLRGLGNRVFYIQTAEDYLTRLYSEKPVSLPNIQSVNLYQLDVAAPFFDSLRVGYSKFNQWFTRVSQEGRKAWISGGVNELKALCIYAIQENEIITKDKQILEGKALKLCTFKVGEGARGNKIGELFLKAAFRYATDNKIENIFITVKPGEHLFLVNLLADFGFKNHGENEDGDLVFVKWHPVDSPLDILAPFDYMRDYFPHYRADADIRKYLVPIRPNFHDILFPDYPKPQPDLFGAVASAVGNAIKLAYLSNAPQSQIKAGDVVLFYRSDDLKAVTSLGVVERFYVSKNPEEIATLVNRRTVYNMDQIRSMAQKPTKIILFRLIGHFKSPVSYRQMLEKNLLAGPVQSITNITDVVFEKIRDHGKS